MSLARRAALVAARTKPAFSLAQRRTASTSSHDEHYDEHHDEHHHETDSTVYPAETFATGFWRNVLLASIAGAVTIKYLPSADENVYLTRWIAMYATPPERSLELNVKHTVQQEALADEGHIMYDAKAPIIHRYRYPQSLAQASPFLNGVGMGVDMSGVVPKTGQERVFEA